MPFFYFALICLKSRFAAGEIANQVEFGYQNMLSTIIIVKQQQSPPPIFSFDCVFKIVPQLHNILEVLQVPTVK